MRSQFKHLGQTYSETKREDTKKSEMIFEQRWDLQFMHCSPLNPTPIFKLYQ